VFHYRAIHWDRHYISNMYFATFLNSVLSTDRYSLDMYEAYVSHTEYKWRGRVGGGGRNVTRRYDSYCRVVRKTFLFVFYEVPTELMTE